MTRAPRPAVGRRARQNKQEGMMHMTQAAREYGTALYELCAAEGLETQVLEQLQALKTLLAQYPAWYKVLACPTIPAQERDEAAEQALRGRVHPYVLNFVRLLIDHGRAEELEGCAEVYGVLYDEAHGILPVCAVTAVPLTSNRKAATLPTHVCLRGYGLAATSIAKCEQVMALDKSCLIRRLGEVSDWYDRLAIQHALAEQLGIELQVNLAA